MNAKLFQESIEYEILTQSIYAAILRQEGINNITVEHNFPIKGRSGVDHQIDVYWEFKQAGVTHKVLIECKNYESAITLEKVRNFFAVLHDIGNSIGIMVTKTGYQSGTQKFAKFYGIGLKLLRKPIEKDWEGRLKNIQINLIIKVAESSEEHPIKLLLQIKATSDKQKERLEQYNSQGILSINATPEMVFYDKDGNVITDELRWWLTNKLDVLDKEPGGPYLQNIDLDEHYIYVTPANKSAELVKVDQLNVEYFVQQFDQKEIVIQGEKIIKYILKDFNSGELEYLQR